MKRMLRTFANWLQRIAFLVTYYLLHRRVSQKNAWLIVGVETASILRSLGEALPGSTTVNLDPNRFYQFTYDFELYGDRGIAQVWAMIRSPIILAQLICRHKGIVYVGGKGLFRYAHDGRRWEFAFLKKAKRSIVCCFTGSEIRSRVLMRELAVKLNRDVISTYQDYATSGNRQNENEKEKERKLLAEAADEFADHIFNPPVDQSSYITRKTHPFVYLVPDELFYDDRSRFDCMHEIVVLHAPSSPVIKGTPLVRAAVHKLRNDGYAFKYVELIGVPHEQVIAALRGAHIVLNQFYAFVPGVFGIEAMANSCALLTSADPIIEQTLPSGSSDAWVVTPYWLVYDNLKALLDNPEGIRDQARRGFEWARKNYHIEAASAELQRIID